MRYQPCVQGCASITFDFAFGIFGDPMAPGIPAPHLHPWTQLLRPTRNPSSVTRDTCSGAPEGSTGKHDLVVFEVTGML